MALSPQPVVDVSVATEPKYVDWAAIIGGAVLASAISFVLFAFGTGIGLSVTSPYPEHSISVVGFALALGFWVLWVSISSLIAGSYLAGRMRRRIGDRNVHEIEVRDGVHGLLVWALSVLAGALLASWVTAAAVSKTTDLAAGAAAGATTTVSPVANKVDPTLYWTDVLFYPAAAGGALTPQPGAAAAETGPAGSWRTAHRVLSSRIVDGKLSDEDHGNLTRLVSSTTGLSEADATKRVDTVVTGLNEAKAEIQKAAEKARKFGILITFLTAASLAVGAAASWWAAVSGGRHRDEATDFSHFFGMSRARRD